MKSFLILMAFVSTFAGGTVVGTVYTMNGGDACRAILEAELQRQQAERDFLTNNDRAPELPVARERGL